jgi:hypothetical protein
MPVTESRGHAMVWVDVEPLKLGFSGRLASVSVLACRPFQRCPWGHLLRALIWSWSGLGECAYDWLTHAVETGPIKASVEGCMAISYCNMRDI